MSIGSAALTYGSLNSAVTTVRGFIGDFKQAGPSHDINLIAIQLLILGLALAAFAYTWGRQRAHIGGLDQIVERETANAK